MGKHMSRGVKQSVADQRDSDNGDDGNVPGNDERNVDGESNGRLDHISVRCKTALQHGAICVCSYWRLVSQGTRPRDGNCGAAPRLPRDGAKHKRWYDSAA